MELHVAQSPFADVTTYLSSDHRGLDALLENVRDDVARERVVGASETFAEFEARLSRHMRIEEELLFPLFEMKTGLTHGPTAVMRDEHRQIRTALGLMRDGLGQADLAVFRGGLAILDEVLPPHDAKEERVLYPMTDRALTQSERARFVDRLFNEPR